MSNGIPNGWIETTLDSVAIWSSGGTPSRTNPHFFSGTIPWLKTGELGDRFIFDSEEKITSDAIAASSAKVFPRGSVVLAMYGATIGKASILGVDSATNQACAVGTPDAVDSRLLYYFLLSQHQAFVDAGKGGAQPNISQGIVKNWPFLLPPLNEQTRIVEKLEELFSDLDAGGAELKAAQKKLAQYRQSLLKAAVVGELTAEWRKKKGPLSPTPLPQGGEGLYLHTSNQSQTFNCTATESSTKTPLAPCGRGAGGEGETGTQLLERILKERRARWEEKQLARFKEQGKNPPKGWRDKYPEPVQPDTANLPELPVGWVWASLSQVGWLDRGKSKHRPRNAPFLFGGPYPFIQTGDIREADTYINQASSSYSEAGLAQSRLWPKGTMCITIAANIGKTAILDIEACFPDSIVGFMSASEHVSVDFIEYFMRSAQQGLEAEAPATAQKNINLEILERVCLPLPPMIEQIYIVQELRQLLESASQQENAIHHSLTQAAAQRKNILKAAFSGQLVPQDPNDEPASVLLERIRAERAVGESTPKKRGSRKKVEKA